MKLFLLSQTCCGGSIRALKLKIFGLIFGYFLFRSIATEEKIAENQPKKVNFGPNGLPPQQVYYPKTLTNQIFALISQPDKGTNSLNLYA